ncbi:peptidoglycan-binding protein [Kutzneria sp. CA-103260]|uniref:peptidoglycan-binding protein n=1 Tax=Kutzneria sp. CA-103260 TaxID=2802641 RepID=UPI001BEDB1E6|nr:peptidoglycan-binding protein [Kutzneria sp. CA-103260]QUQ64524.1 peptidoglycan binding domain-containing protein [Kutzneria sp. CA-103260]
MRKWLLAVLGAVVTAAIAGAAVYMLSFRPAPPSAGQVAPPQKATVKRTDLSTSVTLNGSLGHGTATTFTGRKSGTVTWLPAVGAVVDRGQRLYAVDAKPVALFLGDTPLYRTVDATAKSGPDVAEINTNLRALGFRSAPTGSTFTAGTADALRQWQRRNGLDETGALAVGDVAMLPAAARVDSLKAQPGAQATADLMGLTSTTKLVTATADPAQVDVALLTVGQTVTLSLPNSKQAPGTISAVTSSGGQDQAGSTGGVGGRSNGPTVTIAIGDQAVVSDVDSGSVAVSVITGSHKGVLAVPVGALVVVQGGGYAVQVVSGTGSKLVGVQTGMFADGLVEVSGPDLAAGLEVVTVS